MKSTEETVKVCDPIVRIGHWTLVLAFFSGAAWSEITVGLTPFLRKYGLASC